MEHTDSPPASAAGRTASADVGGAVCAERIATAQRWRFSLHGTSEGMCVDRRDDFGLATRLIDATPLAQQSLPLFADMPNV